MEPLLPALLLAIAGGALAYAARPERRFAAPLAAALALAPLYVAFAALRRSLFALIGPATLPRAELLWWNAALAVGLAAAGLVLLALRRRPSALLASPALLVLGVVGLLASDALGQLALALGAATAPAALAHLPRARGAFVTGAVGFTLAVAWSLLTLPLMLAFGGFHPAEATFSVQVDAPDDEPWVLLVPVPEGRSESARAVAAAWRDGIETRGASASFSDDGRLRVEGSGGGIVTLRAQFAGPADVRPPHFTMPSAPLLVERASGTLTILYGMNWGVCNIGGTFDSVQLAQGASHRLDLDDVRSPSCHAD